MPTKRKTLGAIPLGQYLLLVMKLDFNKICVQFSGNKLNPYFLLFYRHLVANDIANKMANTPDPIKFELVNELNTFVESIRQEAQSPEFNKTLANFLRLSNKNYKSLLAYIHSLFQAYGELVVQRIDLGYKKPTDWINAAPTLNHNDFVKFDYEIFHRHYAALKKHRDGLLKYLRAELPKKPMLGYAWCIEYGLDKGWQLVLMLFLDSRQSRETTHIAQCIESTWNGPITQGHGLFRRCDDYCAHGSNIIRDTDAEAIQGLERLAAYLTQSDYYLTIDLPDQGRAFGKGGTPKADARQAALKT